MKLCEKAGRIKAIVFFLVSTTQTGKTVCFIFSNPELLNTNLKSEGETPVYISKEIVCPEISQTPVGLILGNKNCCNFEEVFPSKMN